MITVVSPHDNLEERSYILDVMLSEFLGIRYLNETIPGITETRIILENKNEIVIKDHFFSRFKEKLAYLKAENLPGKVSYGKNQFLSEPNIPVLYGSDEMKVEKHPSGFIRIVCGIDIFASSFLMISRWEEYVAKEKDTFGRFSARTSIAYKHNFLQRPVVNEYTEFLWNMMSHAGIGQRRKARKFTPYITHDVDFIRKWNNFPCFIRAIAGDLLKKKSMRSMLIDIQDYILTKLGLKKDPYDTFDYLMLLSENNGFQSYFFFMSVEAQNQLNHYKLSNAHVKGLLREINDRGHRIGFHPDLNSYNNQQRWKSEFDRLRMYSTRNIQFGRQHYLQFEAPTTWQIWDEMGMKWDSTLSFDDEPGFRAGCCYSYSTFNFLERKKLKLKERPLIIMDTALVLKHNGISYIDLENKSKFLIDKVIKYQGEFVLLWHNSCFNVEEWKPYEKLYTTILQYLKQTA